MFFILDAKKVYAPILGFYVLGICVIGFDFYKIYGNRGWNNVVFFVVLNLRIGLSNFDEDKNER